ncbi:uncharacterized protein METZ01_LOCUS201359 [marine metagenome]|uniref:Uncharacterized protein n=1 Tax=marine metagenome TaxID=408172 RepID=A0A382EDD8_9ZZZZ
MLLLLSALWWTTMCFQRFRRMRGRLISLRVELAMAAGLALVGLLVVPLVILSFWPGLMVLGLVTPLALAIAATVVLYLLAIVLSVSPLRMV